MNNDVKNNVTNGEQIAPTIKPLEDIVPNNVNVSSTTPTAGKVNVSPTAVPTVNPLETKTEVPVVNPLEVKEEKSAVNPEPTSAPVTDQTVKVDPVEDPGAVLNENLKKVEIDYKPPSKFKVTMLVLFFIFMIAFVLFLPEISTYIDNFLSGDKTPVDEKVLTGKLICTLKTSTTNLDKEYDLSFRFTKNSLEKTEFKFITRGDPVADEGVLDDLAATCRQLEENVEGIDGVSIRCNYSAGKLIETQIFDLQSVDKEKLDSAFSEAGGTNPEYSYQQDMDEIEKNMNASGYSCHREK